MLINENITGLQHIGIPTQKFKDTVDFYKSLGFSEVMKTEVEEIHQPVSFLEIGNLMMEIYGSDDTSQATGVINHIALNVINIESAYETIQKLGLSTVEGKIETLPFRENGIRYFSVIGLNGEKVEFCQRL